MFFQSHRIVLSMFPPSCRASAPAAGQPASQRAAGARSARVRARHGHQDARRGAALRRALLLGPALQRRAQGPREPLLLRLVLRPRGPLARHRDLRRRGPRRDDGPDPRRRLRQQPRERAALREGLLDDLERRRLRVAPARPPASPRAGHAARPRRRQGRHQLHAGALRGQPAAPARAGRARGLPDVEGASLGRRPLRFGRAIVARSGLDAWTLLPERARAARSRRSDAASPRAGSSTSSWTLGRWTATPTTTSTSSSRRRASTASSARSTPTRRCCA